MVVKMAAPGRSFGGVADYCLHDRQVPGQPHPESAERVGRRRGASWRSRCATIRSIGPGMRSRTGRR